MAILQTAHPERHESVPLQPRAVGTGRVILRADAGGHTRIANLRQSGSLKLVFPQTHRPDAEAILVNTAGGITGGDRFELAADVGSNAKLTITTHATARLLMVEPLVFGRAAMKETLTQVNFNDRIRITRDGQPLYLDGMRLRGDAAAHLARPAIANGAGAMASLVCVAPDAVTKLAAIRALLPETAGASMLAEDILVMRLLATDSFEMRRSLVPLLDLLTHNTLPTSWRL